MAAGEGSAHAGQLMAGRLLGAGGAGGAGQPSTLDAVYLETGFCQAPALAAAQATLLQELNSMVRGRAPWLAAWLPLLAVRARRHDSLPLHALPPLQPCPAHAPTQACMANHPLSPIRRCKPGRPPGLPLQTASAAPSGRGASATCTITSFCARREGRPSCRPGREDSFCLPQVPTHSPGGHPGFARLAHQARAAALYNTAQHRIAPYPLSLPTVDAGNTLESCVCHAPLAHWPL